VPAGRVGVGLGDGAGWGAQYSWPWLKRTWEMFDHGMSRRQGWQPLRARTGCRRPNPAQDLPPKLLEPAYVWQVGETGIPSNR